MRNHSSLQKNNNHCCTAIYSTGPDDGLSSFAIHEGVFMSHLYILGLGAEKLVRN